MTEKIPNYGKVNCGENEKQCSCGKTLRVAVVTVTVKFPITPTLKCTEGPNTLTYPIHTPTATSVIQVSIPESSDVQYATKLFQKKKVSDALIALRMAISSVLDPENPIERKPGINEIRRTIENTIREKQSIPKPESGYRCVFPDGCTVTDYHHDEPCPGNCGVCTSLRVNYPPCSFILRGTVCDPEQIYCNYTREDREYIGCPKI